MEIELIHADRRTDGRTGGDNEANSAFRGFANAPNNMITENTVGPIEQQLRAGLIS